jgi:Sec-independent protein translocase protein (TatC)
MGLDNLSGSSSRCSCWRSPRRGLLADHRLLTLIDAPLAHQTQQQVRDGHGPLGRRMRFSRAPDTATQLRNGGRRAGGRTSATQLRTVAGVLEAEHRDTPAVAAPLSRVQRNLAYDIARLSKPAQGDRPVTLGIGEPFTTTVTVSLIFALILALPLLLGQVYGFWIPALAPEQRGHVKLPCRS